MKRMLPRWTNCALTAALGFVLSACNAVDSALPTVAATSSAERAALVDEVASALQACSYDGTPVRIAGVGGAAPSDCRDMVAQIMRYTGLPQNFTVVEAPVPNAAAVILLDDQRIPQRVIAFNKDFMGIVRSATGGNAWAPISIMAHEIGHHLSGHTITPGGSQPPTELEADKFSGFVLFKMGASLDEAQMAMSRLVAEGPDGRTHPGRGKRLAAIREGWQQACNQQGADCNRPATAVAAAPRPAPPAPSPAPKRSAPPAEAGKPLAEATPAKAAVDHLPAPGSTPSKFDRFIHDEYGVLDPVLRAKFERDMFEHARQHGVEIVTLLVRDLHGLSGDAYAHAMLHQLRVGKLDVGNGAVLVVAPDQNEVGIAMGPGVALEMEAHDKKQSLRRWLDLGWPQCSRKQACGNWSENLMLAADHIRRDTRHSEWTIRYQNLAELMTAYNAYNDERRARGGGFDADKDPAYRKITWLDGEVVDLDPPVGDKRAWVIESKRERGRRAVHARAADGYTLMLYMDPGTEALMPAGKLVAGRHYRFIARVDNLSWNPKDTQSFDLLSYEVSGR